MHIEFDDRPDVFYLTLSLLVVYSVAIYLMRNRISENAHVRSALAWLSTRIDELGEFLAPPVDMEHRQENSGKYQDAFYVPGDSVDELNTSPNVPGDAVDVPNTSATVHGEP
ncbi:unnamed protein product [Heligmosomoides polygyrus]|uniref:Uncharacterized protein n=1 Tax=Heligmosomoides polygyrus TaxID=6339 RepID=A0A3P8GD43_HELPZ|nr:unnamed protein product [Heligmosomoides polygyrus]